MRYFIVLCSLFVLAACATQPVQLRHPQTGKVVECGPYETYNASSKQTAAIRERGCIEDFKQQGYMRLP
jgi:hypothetical protein